MFKDAKRLVVKVGSSTLTHESGLLNIRRVEKLVKILSDIKNSGLEVILVSSGAVATGFGKLGLIDRPAGMPPKQAAAAIGQCELMYLYDKLFGEYNHKVAQILLTREDIETPHRKQKLVATFAQLLQWRVLPVVNENDSVATDEIEIGDNDTLSAIVAQLTGADSLVLMSDIDGLYTANPRTDPCAKLIARVDRIDDYIRSLGGGSGSRRGTGGMATKIAAAEIAAGSGIQMAIINGENPDLLYELLAGEAVGTYFASEVEM